MELLWKGNENMLNLSMCGSNDYEYDPDSGCYENSD